MNIIDAAYAVAHDYPGGAESLGPRLNMSGAMMRCKVNPNDAKHHLTMVEAESMQLLTGDHRIMFAMAEALGYMPPLRRVDFNVSDQSLLETYTNLMSELGDFSREFNSALADGRITKSEINRMRTEMREFQSAGEELMNRAEQLVDERPSKHMAAQPK